MIAITLGGARWRQCLEVYPQAVAFQGTPASNFKRMIPPDAKRMAIAYTFGRLASEAVRRQWDGVLVIQDDVRFREDIPKGVGVFGRYRGRDHWCPQAFRFDAATWRQALKLWDGVGQVCRAWEPLILDLPRFDLASDHLEERPLISVGRNAGCRGCGH